MPITAPPNVSGYTGLTQVARLCLETNPGEQLLAIAAGAATLGLTTQPNQAGMATTGGHLHIFVIGNPGSGTMTFAGTAPVTGSAVASQTYHIDPAPLNQQGYTDFTTTEVFATITALTGITMSAGLLPCTVMIFASPAAKFLLPITADAEEHISHVSPDDKRGILWDNLRVVPTTKTVTLDKFDQALTPDSLWALYMLVTSNPTITTVPATPAVLLAALPKAVTMTLTAGPTAPGMFFIFTPGGNSLAGTIVLNGKDIYGNTYATPETIAVGANNNVVYSTRRYSSISNAATDKQFTTTGLSVAATLAVSGVYAWKYEATWDGVSNLQKSSACLELFDGVVGVKLPYVILTDGTITWDKSKELTFSAKGHAQDYLIVGDPNPPGAYPSGTNPFATLVQPTTLPMAGWASTFFLDALPSGTPLSTQDAEFLSMGIQILTGQAPFFVGDGMQRWNDVTYASKPGLAVSASVLWQNYAAYLTYFKPGGKFVLGAVHQGSLLGSITGVGTFFENVTFTVPVKIDTMKPDRTKSPVSATIKFIDEYSFELGYGFKCSFTCQVPPNYTA